MSADDRVRVGVRRLVEQGRLATVRTRVLDSGDGYVVTGIRSTANHTFYRRHGYEQVGVDETVGIALFRKQR